MRRVVVLGLITVTGCTKPSTGPAPTAEAGATADASTRAEAKIDAGGPPATSACALDRGLAGKVAGQDVTMRLVRKDGDTVVGRYAYGRVGVDIPLRGTLTADGRIQLVEGPEEKPSGRFDGTCDASGKLAGTWAPRASGPLPSDKPVAFALERVDARAKPLVATKKYVFSKSGKGAGPSGATKCSYEESWFEAFGARSPEVERRIDGAGAEDLAPRISDPEVLAEAKKCEEGFVAAFATSLELWGDGFATVTKGGSVTMETAAHPANHVAFDLYSVDMQTGRRIRREDVFSSLPDDLLRACTEAFAKANDLEASVVEGNITRDNVLLSAEGVTLYGKEYGHAMGALTGRGPTLPWSALVRDGRLVKSSPVARAWADVTPAPKGAPACTAKAAFR